MSTLSNLSKGSLKNNKSKSFLIALTIMLTTTLLTSVGLTCLNWINVNKKVTIERSGSFHGTYKRTTIDELNIINNNIDIEEFGVVRTVGVSEKDENNLGIVYTDENGAEMGNVKFVEGKMPINENEIAIQDGYLNFLGVEPKVGEVVNIQYESRKDGQIKDYEFIVSGIIETSEINKANKNYTAIISEEFLKSKESDKEMTFSTYVRVVGDGELSGNAIKEKVKVVGNDIGINEYDVKINDDYINALNPEPAIIGGGVVIGLIVVLSSILVIYSIFYVSVINKVQEYGKLRAIGATKKQIKSLILREGFLLATISIPVGILLGYVISNLVIAKILQFDRYGVDGINIPMIIGVFILCYLTVFLSLIKPMKIASKISPVEAMKYNGENTNKKNRNGYDEITIKRLTFANISRNKKKAIVTLLSLSLSGILYITMSTIMSSMDARVMATQHMSGDFTLSLTNYTYDPQEPKETDYNMIQENNPLGKDFRDSLMEISGVKEITTSGSTWIKQTLPSGEQEFSSLSGFGEDRIKELEEGLVEGEINYESLKNGDGVIYTYPNFAEESGVKVGEKVNLIVYDGSKTFEKEFTVEAICYVGGSDFIVPDEVINEMIKTDITSSVSINVESSKLKEVEEQLKVIAENNGYIEMNSLEEEIAVYELSLRMTKILGYSLVIILGIIGFINLINTMITSIITRKKELGMLQAIGLSDRQLVKMPQIEGMFYTFGSLTIILTLGNIIGYIAFVLFKNSGASYAVYSYPLVQTVIMIVAVMVAQILITYLVAINFRKESLVDRVRYSE